MPKFRFATDSEYVARANEKTKPVCIGLQDESGKQGFYLHPRFLLPTDKQKHEKFKAPFAPFDFYNLEYKPLKGKVKNTVTFEIFFFFSFKDIEFLFANEDDYVKNILPNVQRIRRITGKFKHGTTSIKLPWQIYCEGNDGKKRWHKVRIKLFDICAMQGPGGLETYANRVGMVMVDKGMFNQNEKENMDKTYIARPFDMEAYCLGDLNLLAIYEKTTKFFNNIAEGIFGIAPRNYWGLSTGKIVASFLSAWLEKLLELPEKTLHKLTDYAGPAGIVERKNIYRDKDFLYLAMVDGGRCVRERMPENLMRDFYEGFLLDCDIGGCYGVGLRNQLYGAGNPSLISRKQTLRDFLKRYEKGFIPGLWYARVSATNMPFKQDLLVSKTSEAFSTYDFEWYGDSDGFYCSDGKVYDANMVLLSNEIHQAALNHDLLQVLRNYSSEQEWAWFLDNLWVETALVYEKRNLLKAVKPEMLGDDDPNKHVEIRLSEMLGKNSLWVEVPLKELINPLLKERKKHVKKTPMDEFLKLINNANYGVISSEFFSTQGTGISNVVVANNVTARARMIAWCMAKGLGVYMSITDGGVLNVEKALNYKHTSMNVFENVYRNVFVNKTTRHYRVFETSLVDENINEDMMNNYYMTPAFCDIDTKKESDTKIIDVICWNHLKNIFGKLDVFSQDQFVFESKKWYTDLILHSKANYKLSNKYNKREPPNIAFRGVPKIFDEQLGKKIIDPKINKLFEAVKQGVQSVVKFSKQQMLSLAEYEDIQKRESEQNVPLDERCQLLPHDVIIKDKNFYALTPMPYRAGTMAEYQEREKEFSKAKEKEPDNIIDLTKRNYQKEKNKA
jgi:hypothetical protein